MSQDNGSQGKTCAHLWPSPVHFLQVLQDTYLQNSSLNTQGTYSVVCIVLFHDLFLIWFSAVVVPEAVTPQQAASGQTAIMYPSAHTHVLGQMVSEHCLIPIS